VSDDELVLVSVHKQPQALLTSCWLAWLNSQTSTEPGAMMTEPDCYLIITALENNSQ